MGLNLGICREEEKQAKKEVIIGYLTSHLKVNIRPQHLHNMTPLFVHLLTLLSDDNIHNAITEAEIVN